MQQLSKHSCRRPSWPAYLRCTSSPWFAAAAGTLQMHTLPGWHCSTALKRSCDIRSESACSASASRCSVSEGVCKACTAALSALYQLGLVTTLLSKLFAQSFCKMCCPVTRGTVPAAAQEPAFVTVMSTGPGGCCCWSGASAERPPWGGCWAAAAVHRSSGLPEPRVPAHQGPAGGAGGGRHSCHGQAV